MSTSKYPINNAQIELLKLFSTDLSDKDLKQLLSKFFADKAIKATDELWDSNGMSNEDMNKWLNENL